MNEVELLKQRIETLENIVHGLIAPDMYLFEKDIEIGDKVNFKFDTRTGTNIGTTINDKIGFWGVTPRGQLNHQLGPSGGSVIDVQARSVIFDIITDMELLGFNAKS